MSKRKKKSNTKKHNKLGFGLILTGSIMLVYNLLLVIREPRTDMGKVLVNSIGKIEFSHDITVLIIASTASWLIPLLFVFLGITIVKKIRVPLNLSNIFLNFLTTMLK